MDRDLRLLAAANSGVKAAHGIAASEMPELRIPPLVHVQPGELELTQLEDEVRPRFARRSRFGEIAREAVGDPVDAIARRRMALHVPEDEVAKDLATERVKERGEDRLHRVEQPRKDGAVVDLQALQRRQRVRRTNDVIDS